jgi:protein-disulfide isomerase
MQPEFDVLNEETTQLQGENLEQINDDQAQTSTDDQLVDPISDPIEDDEKRDLIHFRRSHFYAALLPLTFIVGLATGYLFWGRSTRAPLASATNRPTQAAAVAPASGERTRLDVSLDDDPRLGPEDAPITIIEFSDFNCSFCRRWHEETYQALLETYPGQILFVYRDFPVVGGYVAAQAANCAVEQDAFWEYHDALFSNGSADDGVDFGAIATQLGLDAEALVACIESGRYTAEVEADFREGADLGVSGTPTFFINGIPLVGAQPLLAFTEIIDGELASR